VFDETAVRTRKLLGLKGGITPTPNVIEKPDPKKPAFAGQVARKTTPAGNLKGLEKEINDLIL